MNTLRIIFFHVFWFAALSLIGQSYEDFCRGWSSGYKEGWCYGRGAWCPTPAIPVCPTSRVGEDTFRDGYNRGFIAAREKRGKIDQNSKGSDEIYWEGLQGEQMHVPSMPSPAYGVKSSAERVKWKHTRGYSSLFLMYDISGKIWGVQYHKQLHSISDRVGLLMETGYGKLGETEVTDFYLNFGLSHKISNRESGYFIPYVAVAIHEFSYSYSRFAESETKTGVIVGLMYRFKTPAVQVYYDSVRNAPIVGLGFVF